MAPRGIGHRQVTFEDDADDHATDEQHWPGHPEQARLPTELRVLRKCGSDLRPRANGDAAPATMIVLLIFMGSNALWETAAAGPACPGRVASLCAREPNIRT